MRREERERERERHNVSVKVERYFVFTLQGPAVPVNSVFIFPPAAAGPAGATMTQWTNQPASIFHIYFPSKYQMTGIAGNISLALLL